MAKYARKLRRPILKNVVKSASKARMMTKKANVASVVSLARQINRVKKQMRRDVEMKKWEQAGISTDSVGQVDGNSTGSRIYDISPVACAHGLNPNERVGNKVVLKGLHLKLQFVQLASTASSNVVNIEVWKTHDFSSLTQIRTILYDIDSISNVIDSNSSFNKDQMGKGAPYQLIGRKRVYIPADTVSGITQFKYTKMFIKQNQELLYGGATSQSPNNVRYFIVMRCQNGNINATTQCTLTGVPITATSTGLKFWYHTVGYYTDE